MWNMTHTVGRVAAELLPWRICFSPDQVSGAPDGHTGSACDRARAGEKGRQRAEGEKREDPMARRLDRLLVFPMGIL